MTENSSFVDMVAIQVGRLRAGEYTGEDIRIRLTRLGLKPKHHNAWGRAIALCITEKLLTPTAKYRPMADPRSHARSTRVYAR